MLCRASNPLEDAEAVATCINETTVAQNDVEIIKEQERIDKIIPDASVTDEEIAELLSGEAEVLKGHGVLG